MIKILLSITFSLFLLSSVAQQGMDEVRKILSKELSDHKINFTSSSSGTGVYLNLLQEGELKQYKLHDLPGDAFYVKANDRLIHIASSTVDGLKNGAWWYLNHLGFRYYFPNEAWYVAPEINSIYKKVEKIVSPSFTYRRIWYAYGTASKKADADYKHWFQANMQGGEEVNAGHSYDGIVNRNKTVFLQHPEYFAQNVSKGKIPTNPKFEPANKELVQLLINDAFAQIESRKKKTGQLPDMLSMDPSDGGGFSTSEAALKIGGPGEQTFYLANRVASAVRNKYPSVKIGLYAYNLHAAPPKFALEPNIVVLVATAMNQSAYRTDELIDLWKKKGVQVGIRDYYGVMAWDWDMPGKVKGSKLVYVNQLKDYYNKGIRYFSAETNIGWISRGLGHYIAAQLLWNVEADTEKIKAEFFQNMFGKASGYMEQLFQSWQAYNPSIPLDGDLYQWSKWVEAASNAEDDHKVQQRIDQVKQYLHYVVLFKKWQEQKTDAHLTQLLNWAYRVQDFGIVASYPLFRRLANSAVTGKQNMRFNDPKAVWKQNNKPVNKEEINQHFYEDLKSFSQSEKTVVAPLPNSFKRNAIKEAFKTSLPVRLRGTHKIIFHVQNGSAASINLSAGLIKAKQFKTLRLSIYPYNNQLSIEGETSLLNEIIQPKQPLKAVALNVLQPGTYIAVIDDAKNGFTLSFTGAVSFGILAGNQNAAWTFGRNNLVFNVGQVNEFKLKNDGVLTLVSPTGRVLDFQKQKGLFNIQVQKGEEGFWKLQKQSGKIHLQGILPLLNADPLFLLQ